MHNNFIDDLVSVIIPVYNSQRFIATTIESALAQTYQNTEIIIIDDCSTDNSYQIINSYISDSRVNYLKMRENSGAAVARNKAIGHAKGRYIAFLDSDDVWNKEKTEKQMTMMKQNNAAISYTAIEIIDDEGKTIKSKIGVRESVDYNYILKNTMIACSSVLIDRYVSGDFRMPLIRAGQDYATWLMLMRTGIKAYGLNEALVKYRRVNGSVSSNKWKSLSKVWGIYRKYEKMNAFKAAYYSSCFALNAFKKYYF